MHEKQNLQKILNVGSGWVPLFLSFSPLQDFCERVFTQITKIYAEEVKRIFVK